MSVTVNHFNLGKNYEALFVCPEDTREYFMKVAAILEVNRAVKSDVFCYDGEKLSFKVKEKLKRSRNVIFVLTSGATERAAADEKDELRAAYAYVWKENPNSLSLMAINDCHLGYGIDYPEDMQSFKWLHRKKFDLSKITCEAMADDLYGEFRLGFSQSEDRRITRLAEDGISAFADIYYKSYRAAQNVLLFGALALICALVVMFVPVPEGKTIILVLTGLASAVLCAVALGHLCFGIMHYLYKRAQLSNVSVLFFDFIRRSLQRIGVLLGIGLFSLLCYGAYCLLDLSDKNGIDIRITVIYCLVALIAIAIVWLIYSNSLYHATQSSSYYIALCEKRPRIHAIFAIVFAILFALFAIGGFVIHTII